MRPPRPERHGGHRRSLVAHLPAFLLGAAVATAVLKLAGPALPALPATLESMRGTEAGSSPQERSESFKVLESVRGSPLLFVTFSNAGMPALRGTRPAAANWHPSTALCLCSLF